jgi:hypothetical protein
LHHSLSLLRCQSVSAKAADITAITPATTSRTRNAIVLFPLSSAARWAPAAFNSLVAVGAGLEAERAASVV